MALRGWLQYKNLHIQSKLEKTWRTSPHSTLSRANGAQHSIRRLPQQQLPHHHLAKLHPRLSCSTPPSPQKKKTLPVLECRQIRGISLHATPKLELKLNF